MRQQFLFIVFLFIITSCNKDKVKAGNDVELYLLSSFQLVPGKCQVDSASTILQNLPLVGNQDILQYNRGTFEYTLSNAAMEKLKQLIGRTPFAITVDKKVIFFGFYMPSYMSSTCFNSITMNFSFSQSNSMFMNLGYPGELSGTFIDDQRNNPKLIVTFANQGKLK